MLSHWTHTNAYGKQSKTNRNKSMGGTETINENEKF